MRQTKTLADKLELIETASPPDYQALCVLIDDVLLRLQQQEANAEANRLTVRRCAHG